MGIVDEDIVRVREATDLVALISQYTQLKRSGQRWVGLCPFHSEKTPSFSVNSQDGFYHCFGCQVSGDAITFLREKEQLDFVGAVESLAGRAGIALRYTDRDEGEGRRKRDRWFGITERAAQWYHERLRTAPDAAAARAYLRHRGFDGAEVAHYRIGWAPDAWDELASGLDLSVTDLEATGLGFRNRAGRRQDFFRARVLFPILDERGRVLGFGGRKLPDADGPKYQNSRDNALYNKSKVLYGLNWAKADAVNHGEMVICEGYTDVIGFARAGVPRAVATCGTALTEDHVRQLRRFTRRLVLAYDADDAGQAAADRVYEWERTHDLEVAVVALPAGSDPDELARTSPETLRDAVSDARPFLEFRVGRVLAAAQLGSAEGRARAADAALAVVAEHPDELVRDQYVMDVADRCRIDAARLRSRLGELRRGTRRTGGGRSTGGSDPSSERNRRNGDGPDRSPAGSFSDADIPPEHRGPPPAAPLPPVRDGVESEALRLAVHHREVAERYLDAALFTHPTVRAAYEQLRATGTPAEAIAASDGEVAALLTRLVVEESDAEMVDVLSRLATEVARDVLGDLESQARAAADPLAYSASIAWLKVRLDELRTTRAEVETLDQLLDWLADRRRVTDQG